MEKNNLTPEESLAIISKAISNFKVNFKESSKIFLLFGWSLTLASLSNFIIVKILHSKEAYELMGPYSFYNWLVFCIITFIILFFIRRKINKDKKVYSYLDNYIKKHWLSTVVGFFVTIVICIKLGLIPVPFMLLIGGIATTTSGLVIKFKPLAIGGISFFIFSIASTFVSNEYISVIVCVAIICGYLIPGYLLKSAKQ
jgi:heme exporter protein D